MTNSGANSNAENTENPSFLEKVNTLLERWTRNDLLESTEQQVVKEKTEKIRQAFEVIRTEISELEKMQPKAEELELVFSVMGCPPCPKVQPTEELIEKLKEIINREPEPDTLMMSALRDNSVDAELRAGEEDCPRLLQSMKEDIRDVINRTIF